MRQTTRLFLLIEGMSFACAGLIHRGVLIAGYAHRQAAIAEGLIAVVLLVGYGLTWVRPVWMRSIGITVQAFALLVTLIGVFTIAIGVGPRTVPDIVYHIAIVAVLIIGLVVTVQRRAS